MNEEQIQEIEAKIQQATQEEQEWAQIAAQLIAKVRELRVQLAAVSENEPPF